MVYADASRPQLVDGFTRKTFNAMVEGVRDEAIARGLIDEAAEATRLTKQLANFESNLAKAQKKLANPNFVERAKPEVVEKEREAARELEKLIRKTQERIEMFKS